MGSTYDAGTLASALVVDVGVDTLLLVRDTRDAPGSRVLGGVVEQVDLLVLLNVLDLQSHTGMISNLFPLEIHHHRWFRSPPNPPFPNLHRSGCGAR